ncbi:MAG: hypothetical protein LBK60_11525 [Verrucomicrobiales bacterium]|jgi:hypothetical protein|nr:hypothetical protein [Verrucomicrobiales bacterium]
MKKSMLLLLVGVCAIGVSACKPCNSKSTAAADGKPVCDKAHEACALATATTAPAAAAEKAKPAADSAQLLGDYQKFAEQYIATAQKAKTGDLSAVASLPGLSKSWQEWSQKIQGIAASLTPEQQKQLQDIAESIKNSLTQ